MGSAGSDKIVIETLHCTKGLINTHQQMVASPLYKQINAQIVRRFYTERLLIDLGDKLISLAEQAYAFRQLDSLGELSQALRSLPLPDHYKSIGRYYRAIELTRQGNLDTALTILDGVASERPHRYTARAIQSLGGILKIRGDFQSAQKLHIEAWRRAAENEKVDLLTSLFVQRNLAVLKSLQGDHRGALVDLERMAPLAKAIGGIQLPVYYDYLNSLAVELGETGRFEEAAHASRIVVSTPFASAYPEWRQTFDELAEKRPHSGRRSAVLVQQPPPGNTKIGENHNLLHLPLAQRPHKETFVGRRHKVTRARVLNFQQWKPATKVSSRSNELSPEQRSRLTTADKLIRLMDLISQDDTDDETIDRILEAVEQIVPNRRGENLN